MVRGVVEGVSERSLKKVSMYSAKLDGSYVNKKVGERNIKEYIDKVQETQLRNAILNSPTYAEVFWEKGMMMTRKGHSVTLKEQENRAMRRVFLC
jgi:uncharacterized protein YqgV (UPF0045/DUF77 family)